MWNDIRFGARMLVKTPAFTIIAVPVPFASFPITRVITMLVVSGRDPITAPIRGTGPVTGVPVMPWADRIPISLHPCVPGRRAGRNILLRRRRRGSSFVMPITSCRNSHANSNGKMRLSENGTSTE